MAEARILQRVDNDCSTAPVRAGQTGDGVSGSQLTPGIDPLIDEQHPRPGCQQVRPDPELKAAIAVVGRSTRHQPPVGIGQSAHLLAELDQPDTQVLGDQRADEGSPGLGSENDLGT